MQKHAPSVMSKFTSSSPKIWAVLVVAAALPVASGSGFQRAQPTNSVVGTINSPIRLEVFSDFECPACRSFYMDTVTRTMKEYGRSGKICILYHEFPLNIHPYGRKAARYSLAAQRIGRRQWLTVMDTLYTKQPLWSQGGEIDKVLAGAVSADTLMRIKEIALEPSIENEIDREIALGTKMGVKSTPTIFVTAKNRTEKVERVLPYDIWKDFFNDILK